jgi:biotin synthase
MCSIINGKSGNCLEDCKYCAQNIHYKTDCTKGYPLLSTDKLLKQAKSDEKKGVLRYSIVTSGKRLSNQELDQVCESIKIIKEETNIEICASFGLLNEEQFYKLKDAGVSRVHCNLESSKNYFDKICTTHTYDDRVKTLNAAKKAGLSLCSGGIMGLGEDMEDRIDMILELRDLGVKSIPVNLLIPIPGTPYENNRILTNDELCRIVAIFRFIIPDSFIRLAGGRELVGDKGKKCFESGANAVISGDMLTTAGITVKKDMQLLNQLGYDVRLMDE